MKNKNVGYLIVGMSIVICIIVLIFNNGLKSVVAETCSHGPSCTMYTTISIQTWFSVAIAGIILVIGLFFVFVKEDEKIIIQKVREKKKRLNVGGLNNEELKIVRLLKKEKGMFQAELMERLEIGKVKTTRLLDKLEAKQLVERKRRGMNNFVVLND
jgi:uncharacterized membrane protein